MLALVTLACLQAGVQEIVEQALAEENKERRQAIFVQLRKHDVAAVEKAVRTRTFGPPKVELGKVVARTSKTELDGEEFGYALHVPEKYDPKQSWPLLVTLHGANQEGRPKAGTDWISAWLRCAAAREKYIIASPTTTRHTWASRQGHSRVLTAANEVARELNVDLDRVYLDGMSMGGGGAFRLTEHHPDRWAAIAPRCNVPDVRQRQDKTYVAMLCENFRNVPIWWAVGARDTIVPLPPVQAARDAIVGMKYDLVYHEFPEGGHNWSIEKDDDVLAWYEKQVRKTYPEEIVWKSYEKTFARAYWVEILRRTEPPPIVTIHVDMKGGESERRSEYRPPARVRARRSGNRIDATCEEVRELRVYLDDAMVDLDKPVTIVVNGKKLHDAVVKRSVEVLIEEARQRRERSMTFSAYVDLKVK